MENQTKAIDFIANPQQIFVMLKPMTLREDIFSVSTTCKGYNDLFCTISDLLKVAMAAVEYSDEQSKSLGKLLEIIYDLIPIEEGYLLDSLYKEYLEQQAAPEDENHE